MDCGAYISDTLRIDNTTSHMEALVEIYRMMRQGEPPTAEAAQGLFDSLFFALDRTTFGGWSHEIQLALAVR